MIKRRVRRGLRRGGNRGIFPVRRGGERAGVKIFRRFGGGFFCPDARLDKGRVVPCRARFNRAQVERNHRKLKRRPALQKQHPVIVRDSHQVPEQGFGFPDDRAEFL